MNIQTQWDFSRIPVNQAFTSRLLVKVEAPRKSDRPRRPLNVAVVLDHSGSMAGAKLQRVKEATKILVEQFGPEDIFSLTVFDTVVSPLVSPMPARDGGQFIARTIEAIHAGSNTNLSGGYLQGCAFARRHVSEERVNRVLLLSDGLANEGITHPHELAQLAQAHRQQNITTSTIGVGRDFNEELMGKMAEQGGGSTYFIDRPEEAQSVFLEELGDLKAVAATGFQIRFAPSLTGVQAAQLNNYDQPAPGEYFLGDILEGIAKYLVLEVQLPPVPQEGRVEIGRLEITFREAAETGFEDRRVEIPVELEVVSLDEFATVTPDREVTLQAAYLTVGAVKAESIRLSDQGQFIEAAAVLENCAKKLSEMQLHDERLDRLIQELFSSARQLRHRGAEYYTPQQRKVTYFESELSRKGQYAKEDMMRQRRGTFREQTRQQESEVVAPQTPLDCRCYQINGFLLAETETDRVLIDTGSQMSIGERSEFRLGNRKFALSASQSGQTSDDISRLIHSRINVWLGMDILGKFDFIVDLKQGKITFSSKPLQIPGQGISLRHGQRIPIIDCRVDSAEIRCFLQTGSPLTFLKAEHAAVGRSRGMETVYFPGLGELRAEVFERSVSIGSREYRMRVGLLPRPLEEKCERSRVEGIIGSALFEHGPVCVSNQKHTLTLG